MKVFKVLFCIGALIAPFCYLASNEIISIMYGNNWGESVACFQWLAIAIIPQMLNSSAGGVFQAIGNTRLLFWNSCINTAITVVAILLGIFVGNNIFTLSFAVSMAYIIQGFTAFYMLIKMGFKFKISMFLLDILPDLLLLFGMELATIIYPFNISNVFLSVIVKLLYLFIVFVILLYFTGEYRLVKRIKK